MPSKFGPIHLMYLVSILFSNAFDVFVAAGLARAVCIAYPSQEHQKPWNIRVSQINGIDTLPKI